MERANSTKYVLYYFVAIFCFAIAGVFVKYSQLPACNTAFYRMLFSLPVLFSLACREFKHLSRRDVLIILLGGLLFGANLMLWNYSLLLTTQANANTLANLHLFATVPLSIFLLKEKIQRNFWLGLAIALAGMAILVTGKADPQSGYFLGDALAFLTCLFYGAYLITVYFVRDRVHASTVMFFTALGSLVLIFPTMAVMEGVYLPRTFAQLWPLLAITLVGHLLGVGLVNLCLGKIRASLASTLSLTQPVIGALLGLVLFKEVLSVQEIIGVVVISFGVWWTQRKPQAAAVEAAAEAAK